MSPPQSIDVLRTNFRNAYEAYVQEGWKMRDLLIGGADNDHKRAEAIRSQQRKLDAALLAYEDARVAYVKGVLAEFAASGATGF